MINDRELRKKHHYCVRCGKQDALTLIGKTLCFECAEKNLKQMKKTYKQRYEKRKPKDKLQRETDIANGICTRCHKNSAEEGYKTCSVCRAKSRNAMIKHLRRNGIMSRQDSIDLGLCAICCRDKAMEGKKLCETCYNRQLNTLKSIKDRRREVLNDN